MIEDKIIYYDLKPDVETPTGTLADSVEFYRKQTDFRLPKKSHVIMMLDGKNFSNKIKKRFQLPFDDNFINMMNETAIYLCKHLQGVKIAYTQSDEISLYITDTDREETSAPFDYRICKLLSIVPALATGAFNKEYLRFVYREYGNDTVDDVIGDDLQFEFDAKVWAVPDVSEVYKWFLYRQNDCVRNSKQQVAQTYLSHSQLMNKHTDEQVNMLLDECSIDWNDYSDDKKYGRYIFKEKVYMTDLFEPETVKYYRNVWSAHTGWLINSLEGKTKFLEIANTKSEE